MISPSDKRIIQAKCREIVKSYTDILLMIAEEIERETSNPINEDDAFLIAKAYTRQQGIREGTSLLLRKINNYASHNE